MHRFTAFPKSTLLRKMVEQARIATIESLELRTLLSTYMVTKVDSPTYGAYGADDGSNGTLRWAVNQANADTSSTINFSAGLAGTITLTSGELQLNSGTLLSTVQERTNSPSADMSNKIMAPRPACFQSAPDNGIDQQPVSDFGQRVQLRQYSRRRSDLQCGV